MRRFTPLLANAKPWIAKQIAANGYVPYLLALKFQGFTLSFEGQPAGAEVYTIQFESKSKFACQQRRPAINLSCYALEKRHIFGRRGD